MVLTNDVFGLVIVLSAVVVAACAAIGAAILGRIYRELRALRRAAGISEFVAGLASGSMDPGDPIRRQTEANKELLSTEEGRRALVEFLVAEASIWGFFSEFEEKVRDIEKYSDFVAMQEEFITVEEPESKMNRVKKGLKGVVKAAFGKANDLVKQYVGGRFFGGKS